MDYKSMFRPKRPIPAAIFDRLCSEQEKRKSNPNWEQDELEALWDETCRQRAMLGKGPVSLDEVKSAQTMASGHIDYTMKCAYYCEELVMSEPSRPSSPGAGPGDGDGG